MGTGVINSGNVLFQEEAINNTNLWELKLEELRRYCKEENLLGQGGYGFVYRGKYKGQDVAIKRAQIDQKHYKSETEKHYTLSHPNVISCLNIQFDGTYRYLVLELAAGTLADLFKKEADNNLNYKKKECERLLELMPDVQVLIQIANGLDFLHSRKLVHGDIKPENILITKKPSSIKKGPTTLLKLSDLGISKEVSYQGSIQHVNPDDTQVTNHQDPSKGCYAVSTIRGSRGWISPELIELSLITDINWKAIRAKGEKLRCSTASDIFAYGLVAFYYLTKGIHPFGDLSTDLNIRLTIISNIKNNKPINFESIDLPVGDPTRDFILVTLKNDPLERPSASQMLSILASIEASERNTRKATKGVDISHWDYLINSNLESWDFSQVWETSTQPLTYSSSETSSSLFTDCVINKFSVIKNPSYLEKVMNFIGGYFRNSSTIPSDDSPSSIEKCVENAVNHHLKHYSSTPSGPHILIGYDSFEYLNQQQLLNSNVRPKVVGLLLPISDLRQIKNASLLQLTSFDEQDNRLKKNKPKSHLYCLFFKRYSKKNLENVIRLVGNNALLPGCGFTKFSTIRETVGNSFTPDLLGNYRVWSGWTSLQVLCECYSAGENLKELAHFLVKQEGIDPSSRTKLDDENALHMLCSHYRGTNLKEMVYFLVKECGIDPKVNMPLLSW